MNKNIFKVTTIAVLVFSMVSASMVAPTILNKAGVDTPNLIIHVKAADDTTPGDGDCGIVNIFVINQSQIDTLVGSDIGESDTGVWAHFDATPTLGESLEGSVPYNSYFGIVIHTQYNYTVAYNVTASAWDADYVSGTIQSADLTGLGTAQDMEESAFFDSVAGTSTEINFYHDNTDTGWSVAHGETVEVTVTVSGYW